MCTGFSDRRIFRIHVPPYIQPDKQLEDALTSEASHLTLHGDVDAVVIFFTTMMDICSKIQCVESIP